jgi:hypothetical protein
MAGSNSNFQLAGTDFEQIKSNLITFLQGQNVLTDANYTGSALSVLLDILSYNTFYNAVYLNLIGSELFLDSATKRSSVVSKAKELGYTPKSTISSQAIVSVTVTGLQTSVFSLPRFTRFLSGQINSKNYTFVTNQAYTVSVDGSGNGTIENVTIFEGEPVTYNFTYNSSTNPSSIFNIPDSSADMNSLVVAVQQSSTSSNIVIYKKASDYLSLDSTSTVYFTQEAEDGTYDVYFGDGILGKSLVDGNVVSFTYISTSGSVANGIQKFNLVTLPSTPYTSITANTTQVSFGGGDRETIESIKFQAPKSYAAQNRAVTKDDYINLIQTNNVGLSFDAVNVWGGEENNPPQYGKIFVAVKPAGGYFLTSSQKNILLNKIIAPFSVLTVTPELVDIDYTYLLFSPEVVYDPNKTALTSGQLINNVVAAVQNFCNSTLNTFNSTFVLGNLLQTLQNVDPSIVTVDTDLYFQKRLVPNLGTSQTYTFNFGNVLENGLGDEAVLISPSFSQYDSSGNLLDEVFFEVIPNLWNTIGGFTILNGGTSYTNPTITIMGDGTGATANAVVQNGTITAINVVNPGEGYTQATVFITDSTGYGAIAIANLLQDIGYLRTYYYVNGVKSILKGNSILDSAGHIDYNAGIVTLTDFNPVAINSTDGILRVHCYPDFRIINSTFNNIITLDNYDPNAVLVTLSTT